MKLDAITASGEPFRYLSVCSGIESATVAWHPLGWECAGVSEIEPFPCQVLARRLGAGRPRYMPNPEADGLTAKDTRHRAAAIKAMDGPHMRWGNELVNFGDFTQIRDDDVGPIDLLVGGTPCQSFSIAGKRLGLDDPRGNLTLEFLALAKRLRPRWLVWENVPGVLSHDDGRTFGTFLGLLAECGFERWAYRVLDAQYVRVGRFGRAVPQRRRRVFVVGYSGTADIHPRAVLLDRESLRGNPPPRREAGQGIACDVAPSLTSSGRGVERAGETRGQDPVIAAFGGGNTGGPIDIATAQTAQTAHGVRLDFDSETFVAHALRAEGFDASEDGTGRGTPLIACPPEVAGTLKACAGNSGTPNGAEEADRLVPVHCFDARQSGVTQYGPITGPLDTDGFTHAIAFTAKDYGADAMDDCSPTLRAGGHTGSHANAGVMPAVAFDMRGREGGSMPEGPHDTANIRAADGGSSRSYVAAKWGVRRLMSVECEKLQGFPPDWTAIEWRGKPADLCPDGPRYKACGNSMAVNVMAWIGERIAAVDALSAPAHAVFMGEARRP